MAYILINKNPISAEISNNKASSQFRVIKSITKLAKALKVNENVLYNHFSRQKKEMVDIGDYRIIKCEIE